MKEHVRTLIQAAETVVNKAEKIFNNRGEQMEYVISADALYHLSMAIIEATTKEKQGENNVTNTE